MEDENEGGSGGGKEEAEVEVEKGGERERERNEGVVESKNLFCSSLIRLSLSLCVSLSMRGTPALVRGVVTRGRRSSERSRTRGDKGGKKKTSLTCCRRWSRRRQSACWATSCAPGWPW